MIRRRSCPRCATAFELDQLARKGEILDPDPRAGRPRVRQILHAHPRQRLPEPGDVRARALVPVVGVEAKQVVHRGPGLGEDARYAGEAVAGLGCDVAGIPERAVGIERALAADEDPVAGLPALHAGDTVATRPVAFWHERALVCAHHGERVDLKQESFVGEARDRGFGRDRPRRPEIFSLHRVDPAHDLVRRRALVIDHVVDVLLHDVAEVGTGLVEHAADELHDVAGLGLDVAANRAALRVRRDLAADDDQIAQPPALGERDRHAPVPVPGRHDAAFAHGGLSPLASNAPAAIAGCARSSCRDRCRHRAACPT